MVVLLAPPLALSLLLTPAWGKEEQLTSIIFFVNGESPGLDRLLVADHNWFLLATHIRRLLQLTKTDQLTFE